MPLYKLLFKIYIAFLSVCSFNINAQTNVTVDNIRHYKLDNAFLNLKQLNTEEQNQLGWQIKFLKYFYTNNTYFDSIINIEKPQESDLAKFYYYINLGDYYYYKFLDKNLDALNNYKKSLELAQNSNDSILICEALKKILTVHRISYLYDNETYKPYLNLYKTYAYDDLELAYYHYYNLILNFKNYYTDKWEQQSYKKLKTFLNNNNNQPYLEGITYTVFASYYEELNKIDSSMLYINLSEKAFSKIKYNYNGSRLNQLYTLKARIAIKNKKFNIAENALIDAKKNQFNKTDYHNSSLIHYYKSLIDTLNNDYKSAYKELEKYDIIQDSLKKVRFSDLLSDLETKYQTEKKEKENLSLKINVENQQRQKRNLWIGSIGFLLFLGITFILIQKNTKRKQLLAEQEKELETQKLTTVLKEQELTAIDAMIEGQEKERQRIANDLHDDLGGLMATVKFHFNALQEKQSPELFDKTNKLLDEAYNKIRTIAHTKNSGVMAKQGLLKAVQNMTDNISASNKIAVEVVDYGLENRLENSLELTLFRIIQELMTNIIKHANASTATIHITNHDDSLNIMVEDNGKGFNPSQITTKNKGMGISSIDKRIEHLNGTMTIESEINKGTTIIIDIPL